MDAHGLVFPVLLTLHVIVGIAIIGLVLLQHGKGADMGAAFGSGSSGSLFGASGSANFLSRTTAVLAAIFFITSLGLSYVASNKPGPPASVMDVGTKPPVKTEEKVDTAPPAAPSTDSKAKDIPK